MGKFSNIDGGTVVQYELARILKEIDINVKIYSSLHITNQIFNDFYNNDFPIDDNVVVIYCEGTQGNPLNAKYVVRWMLSPLGTNVPFSRLYTWNKNELVYYFNSELKMYDEQENQKNPSLYKLLRSIYIPKIVKQTIFDKRDGVCHTFRKDHFHTEGFKIFHPSNSFEITRNHSIEECISYFNTYEIFICYDPLTFYIVIAAICGCIPIVCKLNGLTKKQWTKTQGVTEYLKYKELDYLYGIAYGEEDLQYAKDTIHLVRDQWNDILEYNKQKTIIPFLKDIQNFETLQNTIANNY